MWKKAIICWRSTARRFRLYRVSTTRSSALPTNKSSCESIPNRATMAHATSLSCPRSMRRRSIIAPVCKRTSMKSPIKPPVRWATFTFPTWDSTGLNEFTKLYFPQIRKKALIVDVRGNGGGFVSPLVIERLQRALVMIDMFRNGVAGTDPPQTFTGPMVALIDEFSASDGDIFPFRFKSLGLGKLIGKRTWDGV